MSNLAALQYVTEQLRGARTIVADSNAAYERKLISRIACARLEHDRLQAVAHSKEFGTADMRVANDNVDIQSALIRNLEDELRVQRGAI